MAWVAKWLSDMCGLRTWVANCKWLKGIGGQVAKTKKKLIVLSDFSLKIAI
jgi:hypothetical protein